jgi:protein N-terminal methyltransferase
MFLTNKELVQFLERCKSALNPDGGVVVFKENISTAEHDMFDDEDSSITRCVFWVVGLFVVSF